MAQALRLESFFAPLFGGREQHPMAAGDFDAIPMRAPSGRRHEEGLLAALQRFGVPPSSGVDAPGVVTAKPIARTILALNWFGVPPSSGVDAPSVMVTSKLVTGTIRAADLPSLVTSILSPPSSLLHPPSSLFPPPSSLVPRDSMTTAELATGTRGAANDPAGSAKDPAASWGQATTVLIRGIGLGLAKWRFIEELEVWGFGGQFDFVSVPRLTGRVNLGYAFVNFSSPGWAMLCHDRCHGRVFGKVRGSASRTCEGLPAHQQRRAGAFVGSAPGESSFDPGHDSGRRGRPVESGSSSAGTRPGATPADIGYRSTAGSPRRGSGQPSRVGHAAPAGQGPAQEADPWLRPHRTELLRIYL